MCMQLLIGCLMISLGNSRVGLEPGKKKVKEMLVGRNDLWVVGISGLGGSRKTTLARDVYRNEQTEINPCSCQLESSNVACLLVLVDRMGNEITRLIAVKAFAVIAASPIRVDLSCSGASLALELCCTLMSDKRSSPSVGLAIRNKVLPQALTLIKSSLLQGQALLALQNFFAALVYSANTISANEIDELCDEWVPEPLIPSLNEEPYAPPVLER
ncbi:hypothetical protein AHAS_Ahas12G0107000 [Arachis hypogaea]